MVRSRGSWLVAGATGLLVGAAATAGIATAGIATASSAATAAAPAAVKHWGIIFRAPKISPAEQFTQGFGAVVATGKTTGFAFNGQGAGGPAGETAWERAGRTGATWKKVPFPGATLENVEYAAASSPSNVWAFGDSQTLTASRVLRWTGSKFAVVKTFGGPIWGASVLGPKDVWVYGLAPAGFAFDAPDIGVWHYNGRTWTRVGKNISGGSARSDHDVWGFTTTSVEHWDGHKWTATSVKSLLPPKAPKPAASNPQVLGILALSDSNVYAIGNGTYQGVGGPVVVLHFNGHAWRKLAAGKAGFGPSWQRTISDGSGGLWLPMDPGLTNAILVQYAGGKLTRAAVNAAMLTIDSVSRIPGTTQILAGGFTHAPDGSNIDAVLAQSS
jgi:hypothetical protein